MSLNPLAPQQDTSTQPSPKSVEEELPGEGSEAQVEQPDGPIEDPPEGREQPGDDSL